MAAGRKRGMMPARKPLISETKLLKPPKRVWKVLDEQPKRRFVYTGQPGVVFVLMDRRAEFDGETRIAFVWGVAENAQPPNGEWQRFEEDAVEWL